MIVKYDVDNVVRIRFDYILKVGVIEFDLIYSKLVLSVVGVS